MMKKKKFCNPVTFSDGKRHTNPDPFILRWCGEYYCYATDEAGVKVSKSENLTEWTYLGYAISEKDHRDYWAPSVIYINGKFYMYYSNISENDAKCHEECLKLAISDKPEGPFVWKKTFFDKFSIDSHPVIWNEKLYMFYSVNDWIGTDEKIAGTCILVDEMLSPEEFAGQAKAVVLPGIEQEIFAKNRFGDGRDWYTIEGAAPIVRGRHFWLLYSANAYVNEDYFIGSTVADLGESLMDMEFCKYPSDKKWHPLLKKNEMVEGTGHNTVEKAPDMMEEWIIYHGRNAEEEIKQDIEQREMHIAPLRFNGKEVVCLGPTTKEQDCPAQAEIQIKEKTITDKTELASSSDFYIVELWISAVNSHWGMKYGIVLDETDKDNYIEIQMHSGKNELSVYEWHDGIRQCVAEKKLPEQYDFTVPHLLQVVKKYRKYMIKVDQNLTVSFNSNRTGSRDSGGKISVSPYYTEVNLHSFALTRGLELIEEELNFLSELYQTHNLRIEKKELQGQGSIYLKRKRTFPDFKEEFQLRTLDSNAVVNIEWKGIGAHQIVPEHEFFAVEYEQIPGKIRIIVDGKEIPLSVVEQRDIPMEIQFTNSSIMEYRIKKV